MSRPDTEQGRSYAPTPAARDPRPEPDEPRLDEPVGLRDLSRDDWKAVGMRAGKKALDDQITDLAAVTAFWSFLAIPSALLVFFGVLGLVASQETLQSVSQQLASLGPGQGQEFLSGAIDRLGRSSGTALTMTIVGFVLALWTTTGAATAFMRALNRVYLREEGRSFVQQRIVALQILGLMLVAFLLVFGLIVLGPQIANWLGNTLGIGGYMQAIWWVAQWPILISGLLAAFAAVLYLGPNVKHPRWKFLTPGAVTAAVGWVVASGLFAIYTSMFGSYNQAWGALSAVIVMMMWLWITGVALLFGAEVNVEAERSRELRTGQPAERELQAEPREHKRD